MNSCAVQDAEKSKKEYLTIYSDFVTKNDSLIFTKFEKEEKIKIRFRYLAHDSILQFVESERYNCEADLLLLSDYELLKKASQKNLFLPIKSEILSNNVDSKYRSKANKWFALSKTPLVIIYNENYLSKDTLKNYSDLLNVKWKNKISFQSKDDNTSSCFRKNIHFLMKNDADSFLIKLNKQSILPRLGDDFIQIERINRGEALLSVVKLSSLAESHAKIGRKTQKNSLKVLPIFPNQRKHGCYISISGAGVYRYARNSSNAKKMLEYLSSKRAQYFYAAGKYEFPILKNTPAVYELAQFRKYRGRFYKY